MDKLLFIVNPVAGAGRAKKSVSIIENRLKNENVEFKIVFTKAPKEATQLAEQYANEYSLIVAVGGDGTVNEVAQGVLNSGKGIFGVLPCGTGNDYSKSICIPSKVEEALEVILRGHTMEVDVAKINGYNIFNIASVGFDVDVLIRTNSIKKKVKNRFAYILGVFSALFGFKKKQFNFIIDDVEYRRNLVLLAVGKGKYYGGGLKVLPDADLTDNKLHVCLVRNLSNLNLLFLFPSIFNGKHIKFKKYVEAFFASKIIIENSTEMNINIDGEVIQSDKDIVIELEKAKLKVISNPA